MVAAALEERRIDLYMSLSRGGSAGLTSQEELLVAHNLGSLSHLTRFLCQDIVTSDRKLSSTALFMCVTCKKEVYRNFDMAAIARSCTESMRQEHGGKALLVRALARTLACGYEYPLCQEEEAGRARGEWKRSIRAIVKCAFGVTTRGGDEEAAAASVSALKGLEDLVSLILRRRASKLGVSEVDSDDGEILGKRSGHSFWDAWRHRKAFERDLEFIVRSEVIGGTKATMQFSALLSSIHDRARKVVLSCVRKCLELCGLEDEFHAQLWHSFMESNSLLGSQAPETRLEACLLAISLALMRDESSQLLESAVFQGLELLLSSRGRVVGISCPELWALTLNSFRLLPLDKVGVLTKLSAKIGTHLKESLDLSHPDGGAQPVCTEELDLVALWVVQTVHVLFRELRCRGDWTSGVTISSALGLDDGSIGSSGGSFQDRVFACLSESMCLRLKEEAMQVEEADPVDMAYAQEPRHANVLLWLEMAVKALGEFGMYKDERLRAEGGEVAISPLSVLALTAYSNLLHSCLCLSHCLRGKGAGECYEKAQFLDQMLKHLVYDVLDNFKAGGANQSHQVVYLDALHGVVCHSDVVTENKVILQTNVRGALGKEERQRVLEEATQMSLVGKVIHVFKEVLLARCMDIEQGSVNSRSSHLYEEAFLSLCSIAEAYVSRCLDRMIEFGPEQERGALMFIPLLSVLQGFAQSEKLDQSSREQLQICIESILKSSKARQQKQGKSEQSSPMLSSFLDAMPPTLLALPNGERAKADLGAVLGGTRFTCRRTMLEEAGPSHSRSWSPLGDLTAFNAGPEECAGRLRVMFPPKQTLSSAGDLLHMKVTHAPLGGYDRNNAEALRKRCSCIHLAVHVEIVSEAAFKRVCITLGSTGPCRIDKRVIELRDVSPGERRSFDVLVDIFEFGKCCLVPQVLGVAGVTTSSSSSAGSQHPKGLRFYSDGPPAYLALTEEPSLAGDEKHIEYTFSPLHFGMELQLRPSAASPAATSLLLSDFQQLWILLQNGNRVVIPRMMGAGELSDTIKALRTQLRFSCVTDLLEIEQALESSCDSFTARLVAESFNGHVILCTMFCNQSGQGKEYSVVLHFKASSNAALAPLAALARTL
ncbi:hypothetical protein HOP50_18g82670 [Chloropicon primus]|uniref:Uncharacterized protein n=1 Tax=Chloropicon primus TaxID=1764295 RepID=A0A5B8N0A7_9CHLO|nr:hypothetical protein A3770_18p82440 [Chloropicon primus]UPR04922.1 hypothetical protein HOP50_18g82670 [Chloropicon primus]|eukprot:QDZ25726.1 hypothetical protein A3770_18p82440 [Chloropicon primus]